MSLGGAGVTLQRQLRRQQEQFKTRQEQTRIRQARRREALVGDPSRSVDLADEPMACTGCGQRYPFGDSCPGCELDLVCASYAPQPQPQPQPLATALPASDHRVCGRCLKSSTGEACGACGTTDLLDPRLPADADYLRTLRLMREKPLLKLMAISLVVLLGVGILSNFLLLPDIAYYLVIQVIIMGALRWDGIRSGARRLSTRKA